MLSADAQGYYAFFGPQAPPPYTPSAAWEDPLESDDVQLTLGQPPSYSTVMRTDPGPGDGDIAEPDPGSDRNRNYDDQYPLDPHEFVAALPHMDSIQDTRAHVYDEVEPRESVRTAEPDGVQLPVYRSEDESDSDSELRPLVGASVLVAPL